MTNKLATTNLLSELDLDSFIDSDSDDELSSIPHRTIDEILNASDSSPSSSAPSSPPSAHLRSESPVSRYDAGSPEPRELVKSQFDSRSSRHPIRRVSSTASYSIQFPSLFPGARSNAKPGAALAAAAAASRLVPTPHAAAIKSRAASTGTLQKFEDSERLGSTFADYQEASPGNGDSIITVDADIICFDDDCKRDDIQSADCELLVKDTVIEAMKLEFGKEPELDEARVSYGDHELVTAGDLRSNSSSSGVAVSSPSINIDDDATKEEASSALESQVPVPDSSRGNYDRNNEFSFPGDGKEGNVEEYLTMPKLGDENSKDKSLEVGSTGDGNDNDSSLSDISELVEERMGELESLRMNERAEKKLRVDVMKPLELAEELEKKQAYTGLHLEEGAAAQPMRLEGVRRGSTTLGYFDIHADNIITRTISSQAFKRDHGSPQVLAIHLNYIAVGMSKGVILVVPSKYSAHGADNMDSKLIYLGLQGERTHSPVTAVCFNQQGDLLLAGYGDGHITIWDVLRASAAKIITGEHTAPVVHTLFLGRDSQVSRQFKAVTGDSKGLVLLHTSSVLPLLNMFSVKTQCLLDGRRSGTVLSASPLLLDESCGGALPSSQGNGAVSSSSIGSMMGGVVGGEAGWKLFNDGSSLAEEGVVIFVSYQTTLVVRLATNLEIYAKFSRPEGVREGSIPYTAWKCTTESRASSTDNSSGEVTERVSLLAIAWDRQVQVAKLVKSELKVYGKWSLDSTAIGVAWLDDQMLVVLTLTGQLCLFAKDGTIIHQTKFSVDGSGGNDLAAYHTYFTNVFGNPEKAYHNSIAVRGASVYILGPVHFVLARLLPWKERIHVLRRAGDWMGALNMAMNLYDGQAHGVIDLPRTLDAVQEAIMPFLVELLFSYVDEVFSYIAVAFCNQTGKIEHFDESKSDNSSTHAEIKEQFTRVGGVAVEFCVHIKRTDILFDEIFSKFLAVQQRDTFLELLEPYVLKDMVGSLPPEIMQALVEHYSSKGWLQRVEQCVLHMDISSLDFNQVVRLCREHALYGALVYLFNKGLDDFRSPLEELLVVLRNSEQEISAALGYRMLVYLKYCFMGFAFPPGHGTLPPTRLPSLRMELVQFLLEDSDAHNKQSAPSSVFKGKYLNLYHLLELDTEASLDVLRCAFVEYENPKSDSSQLDSANTKLDSRKGNNLMPECGDTLVQNTIDALVHLLDDVAWKDATADINETRAVEAWPSKKDIGHLLEFITYYVAHARANISKGVLTQLLVYLTSGDVFFASASPKMRENQLLSVLKAVPESDWDASYVLQLCDMAQFYQVCGFIHTIRHQYLAALDSYTRDVDEPIHAFSFIYSTLLELRGNEFAAFRSAVITRISELIGLSREAAFFLIIDHLHDEASHILSKLHSHPRSLFLYLKTVIEVHLSGTLNFSNLRKYENVDAFDGKSMKNSSRGLAAFFERLSDFNKLVRLNPVNVTDDMIELYVELLCKFESSSVLKFLETFDSYRVEHCLRLCQEYGIVDAAAYLLERVGDVGSALILTLSGLNDIFPELDVAVQGVVSDSGANGSVVKQFSSVLNLKEVKDIRDILHACIGLCRRNTPRLNPEESKILWFRLLDTFCEPLTHSYGDHKKSEESQSGNQIESMQFREDERAVIKWEIPKSPGCANILRKLFSQFIKEIVEGMIGYVCLTTIMSKLLSDNGAQEFGDFKLTILGMLGTYGFERRILDTAKCLIEDDTFYTMNLLRKGASHGYAPRSFVCCICNCPLTKNSSLRIRVFNCGHATHLHCELPENDTSSRVSTYGCPLCMPKKTTQRSSKKSFFSEEGLVRKFSSKHQPVQQTTPYTRENDVLENSIGIQQLSRFDILNNLQKDQKLAPIESLPLLRLAPPLIYHEKVKRGTDTVRGESSTSLAITEKPRNRRRSELSFKGSSLRFPRFGKEKTGGR